MSTDRAELRKAAKLALELGHECATRGFVRCAMCEFKPEPQEILDLLDERDTYRRFASSRAALVREKRRMILALRERVAKLEPLARCPSMDPKTGYHCELGFGHGCELHSNNTFAWAESMDEQAHNKVTFPRDQFLLRYKDGYEPPAIFDVSKIEPLEGEEATDERS